jgi:hypothetical protein
MSASISAIITDGFRGFIQFQDKFQDRFFLILSDQYSLIFLSYNDM